MSDKFAETYELKKLKIDGTHLCASLFIPENLVFFDGHFEGFSILPGVTQLHWAISLSCEHLDVNGFFTSINLLKFKKIIQPNSIIQLNATYYQAKNMIQFIYSSSAGQHSIGKVKFAL